MGHAMWWRCNGCIQPVQVHYCDCAMELERSIVFLLLLFLFAEWCVCRWDGIKIVLPVCESG